MEQPKSDIIPSSAALAEAIAKNLRGPMPDLATAAEAAAQLVANLTFTNGATQTTYVLRNKVEDVCECPACTLGREVARMDAKCAPAPATPATDQPVQAPRPETTDEALVRINQEAALAYRDASECRIMQKRHNLRLERLSAQALAIIDAEHKAAGGT